MTDRKPTNPTNPTDKFVGARLRLLRKTRGLSQQQLAAALGVKFQQVQKYETGANRISAGKLYDAARFFDVLVQDLFPATSGTPGLNIHAANEQEMTLLRAFRSMDTDKQRALTKLMEDA